MRREVGVFALATILASTPLAAAPPARADSQKVPVEAPATTAELIKESAAIAMPSVVRIVCTADNTAGTGFFHESGGVITAAHVVRPCTAAQLQLHLSSGKTIAVASAVIDTPRDLALLRLSEVIAVPALALSTAPRLDIGDQLAAWGFPSGYRGDRPLLTVGYLAGEDRPGGAGTPSQFVVNAAFNRGNSGGPVIRLEDGAVVGVVSSKLAPLPASIESDLKALGGMKSGMQYSGTTAAGEAKSLSEAQVVAGVLQYLRSQTQLVVGYAVKLGGLQAFLRENGVEP